MAKTLQEVVEQMASHGIYLPPNVDLVSDNRTNWKRFKPVDSRWKRGKEVFYGIWETQLQNGKTYYFGCYGIGGESYKIEHTKTAWSADEWKELQARKKQDEAVVEKALADKRADAAKKSARMWEAARPDISVSHPYIVRKQIKPYGARQLRNQLLIPLYRDKKMVGMQTIFPAETEDGSTEIKKLFVSGSDTKGSYRLLGSWSETPEFVYVCEGWATGCTIHEATGLPVFVAFNAGNLYPVVERLRKNLPNTRIGIAADNDCHFERKLKRDVKEQFGAEIFIGPNSSDTPIQSVATKDGMYALRAFESLKDGERCIYYECKRPGQQKPSLVCLYNTGITKAKAAAKKFRCSVLCPQFKDPESWGTDFNDLAIVEGLDTVRAQLDFSKAVSLQLNEKEQKAADLQARRESRAKAKQKKASEALQVITALGERYVYIYPEDVCWDLKEKMLVRIGVLRQCYESKLVTAYLTNAYGNLKQIRKDQLVFYPEGTVPPGCVNTFTGFEIKPNPRKSYGKLVDHLRLICEESDNVFDWVVRWLAYPIQHPGAKMHTALVVFGEKEGTGKSMFFDAVARIYGKEYSRHVDQRLMTSRFNAWLSHKLFVVADEVVTSKERRELKGILKNLITSPTHQLEEKNMPVFEERNLTNFVYLSNEMQPLALDWYDRRYVCLKYNGTKEQNEQYFQDLSNEIENGGIEALYHYLLDVDLGDFKPSTPAIETEAKRELKKLGTDSARRFVLEWLDGSTDFFLGPAPSQDFYRAYKLWLQAAGERQLMTSTAFGIAVSSMLPKLEKVRLVVYDHEFNPNSNSFDNERVTKEKRLTVYFPDVTQEELAENPPDKTDLGIQLRKFQESLYEANRRQRNNGHI